MNKTPIHKLKLMINNKPILIHTIEHVLNSDINKCIIMLGHYSDELYSLIEEYDLIDEVEIKVNPDVNVGLSKTIENAIKDDLDEYYLFTAADQPTITTKTINNMINCIKRSSKPSNTISILRRIKIGRLDSAEGLGMPFCCYARLLYDYIKDYNDNLNPILRQMIKNNVDFYALEEENKLELLNINHYEDYMTIKNEMEK